MAARTQGLKNTFWLIFVSVFIYTQCDLETLCELDGHIDDSKFAWFMWLKIGF